MEAKRTEVGKVARASAFSNRQDVVRVPQAFAMELLHAPDRQKLFPAAAAGAPQQAVGGQGIDRAARAHASVAQEHGAP